MTTPSVCVVIVTYNNAPHLARCVADLSQQIYQDFEVIIVDNGSGDGAIDELGTLPPNFRLLRSPENLGFAKANNWAARNTQAEWLATLNADAFPEPDWLERLRAATDRHPDAPMFGSTQIDFHRPDRLDGAGDLYHATGLVWRSKEGRPVADAADEQAAFGPCAAAALYRRDAFLAAGGFDERFFCYCEDIDLAFRLRLAGGRNIQVAEAVVRHVGSASAGRRSDFSVYHGTRNRLWTFVKNMPGPLFWPLLPVHLLASLILLLRAAGRGSLKSTWGGMAHGVRGLGPIWATRREIQRQRRASTLDIARALRWSPLAPFRRRTIDAPGAESSTFRPGCIGS
ncbi:glycosyltransferase family 2 protein [Rhodospirillaceae bacterium SYSU D60014]|uniref:glycosyltransferase family 2 protein n=1 Tax=Virgifigura deserti TaxID=2268457 RepID=UPI000E66323C